MASYLVLSDLALTLFNLSPIIYGNIFYSPCMLRLDLSRKRNVHYSLVNIHFKILTYMYIKMYSSQCAQVGFAHT